MLTKMIIDNFKRFGHVQIELANTVVFIGPNDSGKTTALQALTLWNIGLQQWNAKRKGKKSPEKRPAVTVNRNDLLSVPIPSAKLLWRDLHVRYIEKVEGKQTPKNVLIQITVEGVTEGREWKCGLEFDYANEEVFYCRPLRLSGEKRMPIPDEAGKVQVAFLPPMSGLASNETRLDPGAINVRIGEGRTAEILRNLCSRNSEDKEHPENWKKIAEYIQSLFGVKLDTPKYIAERGEIVMTYHTMARAVSPSVSLDLSSSGRGLQQTLLLLSYMYANPHSVILLDEPDAHLEILRQRQIYEVLTGVAREQGSQIIAASHSEVILNEAAGRDIIVAFLGEPHSISDRGSQVLKSLKDIGFEQYYQAEQTGWVLYLEGSNDLAILRAFADTLSHEAVKFLERPFVYYVANQPSKAKDHFYGLKEAKKDLVGIIITDRLDNNQLDSGRSRSESLLEMMWKKREIENYLCYPKVLLEYAEESAEENAAGPLFSSSEGRRRRDVMDQCIKDLVPRVALNDLNYRWWNETKVTDEFLDPLFEEYFKRLKLSNLMPKANYHVLARKVPADLIDREVREKLDSIVNVAKKANPLQEKD
ncbi:MAG: AAA family ATPase [candidate division Zixibacteria bacterium]|nr:AAA family ATPase [candidate division Zixibacteria bacterium]